MRAYRRVLVKVTVRNPEILVDFTLFNFFFNSGGGEHDLKTEP